MTRKLFGALLILPFHDIPVLIRLLKILSSSLQNGRYTVSVQVGNPNHDFKLDNDFLNAVSLNFPKPKKSSFIPSEFCLHSSEASNLKGDDDSLLPFVFLFKCIL